MTRFAIVAKFVLTVLLLWLMLHHVEPEQTWRNISAFTAQGLATALALLALQQLLAACRLAMVVTMFGEQIGFAAAVRISLIGFFFGQTFLSFLGGDAARLWELTRQNITLRNATSGVLLDRLSGLIANHLLILAALPWIVALVVAPVALLAVIAVAGGGAAAILMLFLLAAMRGKLGLEKRLTAALGSQRIVPLLFDLVSVLRVTFAAPVRVLGVIVLSLAVNVLNAAMIYVLFLDLGAAVTLPACLVLVPLVMELAMIPISIAGWGVREGLMVFAFGLAGVAAEVALSVSVMFGLIGIAFGLVGCTVWLAGRSRGAVSRPD